MVRAHIEVCCGEGTRGLPVRRIEMQSLPVQTLQRQLQRDPNVKGGAGEQRTVQEWQQWWYELTGERDTRTVEEILSTDPTVTETECAEEQPTVTTGEAATGEDNLQPTVPNVDIIWTTAMGAVKHRAGPIALLGGEMQQFSRDVSCWISEMSKPDTCNGVADSIMFVARDETGAVLANVELFAELFAELFSKQKVWKSITRG